MKLTALAWLIFFGGFAVEIAIDYSLRLRAESYRAGGLPELVWFGLQLVLAAMALAVAFAATRQLHAWWKRLLIVGAQAALGFALYVVIVLRYVVGTGIDSL